MTMQLIDIESAAVTDRGLSEKRPQNEDAFINLPSIGLFVVADGVGGTQAGDVASQMATEILAEAFSNLRVGGDAEERMKAAIRRANEAIYQMSSELSQLSTMATTIAAVHIGGNIATIGHVGDSRVYRIDPRGHIYRETQDHSVVEDEVRAGRITAAQAAHHPSRNVINRALGVDEEVEIDLKTLMIEPKTTFLICSDGITRHIDDIELRELLSERKTPKEICDEMRHICYSRGAEDNLTAVVVRVAGMETFADEESTISSGRSAFAAAAISSASTATVRESVAALQTDIETPPSLAPSGRNFDALDSELEKLGAIKKEEAEEDYSRFYDEPRREIKAPEIRTTPRTGEDKAVVVEPKTKSGGIALRILGPIALLLAGGAAGTGIYHNFFVASRTDLEPARIENPLPNITHSVFETNRREVDENPEAYLRLNENRAEDAEDYYLLARASLLLSKYPDAKSFLVKAKARLPQAEEANRAVLTNDIAAALSIVDSEFSRRIFENILEGRENKIGSNANVAENVRSTRSNSSESSRSNSNAKSTLNTNDNLLNANSRELNR